MLTSVPKVVLIIVGVIFIVNQHCCVVSFCFSPSSHHLALLPDSWYHGIRWIAVVSNAHRFFGPNDKKQSKNKTTHFLERLLSWLCVVGGRWHKMGGSGRSARENRVHWFKHVTLTCWCFCSAQGGGNIAFMVIGAIVFIVVGIFAFITSAKGRQSRPLGKT
jgi:hypothetical protein